LPSSSAGTATFRKRRLTKAHHPLEETDHKIDQEHRDTFWYASEIEGLDEEHPLQTHHLEHSSPESQKISSTKLPFSDRIVGTFSCHGLEPFNLRRYMTDVRLRAVDPRDNHGTGINDSFLMEKVPVIRKINQDRGAIAHPYDNDWNKALFSVFDGHGQYGDQVAEFSMVQLLSKLKKHPDFKTNVNGAFKKVFLDIDQDLGNSLQSKSKYSGCTACVVLVCGKTLYMANVGDSRAVLARRSTRSKALVDCKENIDSSNFGDGRPSLNKDYVAVDLTVDQHPALPEERKRIEQCGGHISFSEGPDHPRVWLDASHSLYGLAMSRSLGDLAMKSIGVTAEPVLSTYHLTEDDEFLIIATDGVWGVLNSSDAVTLVGELLDRGKGATFACELLIETAMEKWRVHEGDYRDDCTSIVINIKDLWKEK